MQEILYYVGIEICICTIKMVHSNSSNSNRKVLALHSSTKHVINHYRPSLTFMYNIPYTVHIYTISHCVLLWDLLHGKNSSYVDAEWEIFIFFLDLNLSM